jgi:hypothetical protein
VRFWHPAQERDVAAAEHALGSILPGELRGLLLESDGLADRYGTSVVWTAGEIARRNGEFRVEAGFRELYMPFDAMLFFGEAGDGDQFFYRILDGQVRHPDVYIWSHETDSRIWRAPTLAVFLERQLATLGGP